MTVAWKKPKKINDNTNGLPETQTSIAANQVHQYSCVFPDYFLALASL